METDTVKAPAHYMTGGLEVIEILRKKLSPTEFIGFLKGNVLKYLFRYEEKNGVEDLRKASLYLEWLTEEVRKQANRGYKEALKKQEDCLKSAHESPLVFARSAVIEIDRLFSEAIQKNSKDYLNRQQNWDKIINDLRDLRQGEVAQDCKENRKFNPSV